MAIEIERKFLVTEMRDVQLPTGLEIDQGYLNEAGAMTVRVRTKGTKGYLTIKAPVSKDDTRSSGDAILRHEFEYEIPFGDAKALLELALARLHKTRYLLPGGIELDIFHGRHDGLVMAEFESEDGAQPEPVNGISWVEVTSDPRYSNSWMARNGIPPLKGK